MVSHIIAIKMEQSVNKTIQFKSGGPHPLTLASISVARKESHTDTKRPLRARTTQSKELLQIISEGSNNAIAAQTTHMIKSVDSAIREEIVENFKSVNIPADHVASMKASLNLPWNQLQDIRRWLKTFKVNLSSEKNAREVVKEWVGEGVRCEEVPATVNKYEKNFYRTTSMVLLVQFSWLCVELFIRLRIK